MRSINESRPDFDGRLASRPWTSNRVRCAQSGLRRRSIVWSFSIEIRIPAKRRSSSSGVHVPSAMSSAFNTTNQERRGRAAGIRTKPTRIWVRVTSKSTTRRGPHLTANPRRSRIRIRWRSSKRVSANFETVSRISRRAPVRIRDLRGRIQRERPSAGRTSFTDITSSRVPRRRLRPRHHGRRLEVPRGHRLGARDRLPGGRRTRPCVLPRGRRARDERGGTRLTRKAELFATP
ncbi:hypothetical protein SAMN04488066_104213 [Halorubrum aquaticum]|uniref:Uncharacterized protein n=1 Tax=Halorubrum aquaticum TaxID=387340 RepID=A0A1I3A6M8_9EURY|nr:hypothetical protein SAMN04488066_104213 [Halorubrum aquaticum]